MEESNKNKIKLFVKTSVDSGSTLGYGFIHEGATRTLEALPQSDFFIPIFLEKNESYYEYVDVTHDDTIFTMQRQLFNPFFLEFEFFDDIQRNKVNNGEDLTLSMIFYIRNVRTDIANLSNEEVKTWFDNIGRYELPWNKGEDNETTLDDLDEAAVILQNIVSKAHFLGLTINK